MFGKKEAMKKWNENKPILRSNLSLCILKFPFWEHEKNTFIENLK